MNVFEDLVEELREENLLEQTIVNVTEKRGEADAPEITIDADDPFKKGIKKAEIDESADALTNEEIEEAERFLKQLEAEETAQGVEPENKTRGQFELNVLVEQPPTQIPLDPINPPDSQDLNETPDKKQKPKLSDFEYFRKRAMEEVSSLQMVDNIFSSIEREQLKNLSKPFDDLTVKKVLHSFMKLPPETSLSEQAEAEFELRAEIERWICELIERDAKISVENLRYCCETTRPPLSAPALLSLARFYRSVPFSEAVRNKFDLILTRLFAKDVEENKRELVFTREELIGHLTELYADWESISFYPADENHEEISLTVIKFEDLMAEADNAKGFDDLIETEFFNRVRALKRSTGENFFAPKIASTAIVCNVRIGNRYLELVQEEKEKSFAETIEEKYGFVFDQSISEATNKSLQLAELLKQRTEKPKIFDLNDIERKQGAKKKTKTEKNKAAGKTSFQWLYSINKGILALTLLSVLITAGLYFWVEVLNTPPKMSEKVRQFSLENTEFNGFIESARINNETLFAIAAPAWETLPLDKKEEILGRLFSLGVTEGFKKVHLLDKKGLTAGSATQDKIELK